MNLKVRSVKIDLLIPDPQNVRTHDQKNLEAISRSLAKFGQRKPIVVAKANDGSLVVIAGNGTLEAAKSLGWESIDVVDAPADWDADTIRAYAIADNRTAELADWNQVALTSALVDLDAVGWDLQDLGFKPLDPSGIEDEDGNPKDLGEKFEVVIECASEDEQAALLLRLSAEGLKVRAIVL